MVVEHVKEMQGRIDKVTPLLNSTCMNMNTVLSSTGSTTSPASFSQATESSAQQVSARQPHPSVRSWLTGKALAHWQGPFPITEHVGPMNYHLQQPHKHKDTQLYHINLLNCWTEPLPVLSASMSVPTEPPGHTMVHWGEDLTHNEQQEIRELVEQFGDVFSVEPG